ncbi:MAG: MarR family transcriptional regulator [Bacteroidia bacterium]
MNDLQLEDVYIYQLERTVRQLKRHFQRLLEATYPGLSITSDQWIILKRISENDALSQREVAGITFKDPASVTRTLDLMARKGWICRETADDDRRVYHLTLTEQGWDLIRKITPLAQQVRQDGLRDISATEVEVFRQVLAAIFANVS